MRKKIRVGKSTTEIVGSKCKKKRHFAEIDEIDGKIVVAEIYTHDPKNPKHEEKMRKKLRKPIKNFSKKNNNGKYSVVDSTLYTEKGNNRPIKTTDLNYDESNFEFNEEQSRSIRRFIFSHVMNRIKYLNFVSKNKKKDKH